MPAELISEDGAGRLWCPGGDRQAQGDGYRLDVETGVWCHNACMLPTREVYQGAIDRGDWDILATID